MKVHWKFEICRVTPTYLEAHTSSASLRVKDGLKTPRAKGTLEDTAHTCGQFSGQNTMPTMAVYHCLYSFILIIPVFGSIS